MTELQLQYCINARKSKSLCKDLEELVEFADYCEKLLNENSRQVAVLRYKQIKLELDALWDEQIDLFFQIADEYKEKQKLFIIEKFKIKKPNHFTEIITIKWQEKISPGSNTIPRIATMY